MKKLLSLAAGMAALFGAMLLAGCATIGAGPAADLKNEAITAAAVAGEIAVRQRCPRNEVELGVLLGARVTFDLGLGTGLSPAQLARIDEAREQTNAFCGIVRAAAPPDPPASQPTV